MSKEQLGFKGQVLRKDKHHKRLKKQNFNELKQ